MWLCQPSEGKMHIHVIIICMHHTITAVGNSPVLQDAECVHPIVKHMQDLEI